MKMKSINQLTLGLFSLVALAACSPNSHSSSSPSPAGGIINGDTVSADDLIAQTTVGVVNVNTGGLCSGSLIRENLVLTAAHCTAGANAEDLLVIFDRTLTNKSPRRRVLGGVVTEAFARIVTSEDLPPTKDWEDISVLKIEGSTLPAGYQMAAVLFGTQLLPKTETVFLAGYGMSSITADPTSSTGYKGAGTGVLRKAAVTLADAQYSPSEILVATTDGKGSCHGDSGGPAYLIRHGKISVVGVTSRANSPVGAVQCNGDTVYTSVPGMQDFIKKANLYLESPAFEVGGPILVLQ